MNTTLCAGNKHPSQLHPAPLAYILTGLQRHSNPPQIKYKNELNTQTTHNRRHSINAVSSKRKRAKLARR